MAAMSVVLFGIVAYAILLRPTRLLDVDDFKALPLKRAELVDGVFQGGAHEQRWYKFKYAERVKTVAKFGETLRLRGLANNSQVRDSATTTTRGRVRRRPSRCVPARATARRPDRPRGAASSRHRTVAVRPGRCRSRGLPPLPTRR